MHLASLMLIRMHLASLMLIGGRAVSFGLFLSLQSGSNTHPPCLWRDAPLDFAETDAPVTASFVDERRVHLLKAHRASRAFAWSLRGSRNQEWVWSRKDDRRPPYSKLNLHCHPDPRRKGLKLDLKIPFVQDWAFIGERQEVHRFLVNDLLICRFVDLMMLLRTIHVLSRLDIINFCAIEDKAPTWTNTRLSQFSAGHHKFSVQLK